MIISSTPQAQTLAGVRWVVLERWASRAWTLLVFTVVARILVADEFGAVAFATALAALVTLLLEQGLTVVLVQRKELSSLEVSTAHAFLTAGSLILAGAGAAAAPWVERWSGIAGLAPVLQISFITMVLASIQVVPLALMQRHFQFRAGAIRKMVSTTVGGCVGLGAALLGVGAISVVLQSLAFAVCGALLLIPGGRLWVPLRMSLRSLMALWRGSVVIGLTGLLGWVSDGLDKVLIGAVLGATALGLYTVANRLLLVLDELITASIFSLALPLFSRLHGQEGFWVVYTRGWGLSAAIVLPAYVGLSVVAGVVVPQVFGSRWTLAGELAQVLALTLAVRPALAVDRSVLFASERPRIELWLTGATAALNAVALVVGAGIDGLVGAAWGLVVVSALASLVRTWLVTAGAPEVRRELGRLAVKICLSCGMCALVAHSLLTMSPQGLRLLFLCLAVGSGALTYIASMVLLDRPFVRTALALARGAVSKVA